MVLPLTRRASQKVKYQWFVAVLAAASFVAGMQIMVIKQGIDGATTVAEIPDGLIGPYASVQENTKSSIPIMELLSDSSSFISTVETLYEKYGSEIAAFRPTMRTWCEKTDSCKFTDFEVEMMYMLIREVKPQKVFEMAPNRGFSTHWILKALTTNDETSKLYSFDIHDASVKEMTKEFEHRWIFTLGDYEKLLETEELKMDGFDFIFIDALHTEEFSRAYCKKLLYPHKSKAVVAIHDIVANKYGGGRESSEVYKYMAFADNIKNVFTMSRFAMPTLLGPVVNAIQQLHKIRSAHGIIMPCSGDECKEALYDSLYFKNNDAPTIFFQLN
mmetsp:Transcript_20863/g.26946  ORF Transcript_20863/g.26946 Transcript_20863/m.26946 type:complete len:330 (-) Transcript_20863:175-1164(-)|eukprot:CAMPEP_0198152784 /NCGR_PEP_ID=MMETSP1443-20131203/61340_1 /TAXON_ID=186043 /ORGANISM="Entomoneis sp., Strain CCMP2396" /LENGTH=329 /DNA_ID=CAMNT_0043818909 /DNA_START=138 /DNA_END=1127 /DNA_ORIENTATION=+